MGKRDVVRPWKIAYVDSTIYILRFSIEIAIIKNCDFATTHLCLFKFITIYLFHLNSQSSFIENALKTTHGDRSHHNYYQHRLYILLQCNDISFFSITKKATMYEYLNANEKNKTDTKLIKITCTFICKHKRTNG